jgi:hypothetical protein
MTAPKPQLTSPMIFLDAAKGAAIQVWRTTDPKTFVVARRGCRPQPFVEKVVVMDSDTADALEVLAEANQSKEIES